jgi:hypothetical protein
VVFEAAVESAVAAERTVAVANRVAVTITPRVHREEASQWVVVGEIAVAVESVVIVVNVVAIGTTVIAADDVAV